MEHHRPRTNGIVFVASEAVLTAWSAQAAHAGEVVGVSHANIARALEVITHRKPHMIVLEQGFACSERGAGLIRRLRTDVEFRNIDIRFLSPERVAQICRPGSTLSLAALAHPIEVVFPMD